MIRCAAKPLKYPHFPGTIAGLQKITSERHLFSLDNRKLRSDILGI
jgi:hypothetical protein